MRARLPLLALLAVFAAPLAAEEERAPAPPAAGETPESAGPVPAAIQPEFVRPLVPIARGRNDANPAWSPDGSLLAFERARGDNKEIVIARPDGGIVRTIAYRAPARPDEAVFFFPGVVDPNSYNSGVSWSPRGDRFVFMSNAGEGNYDLYLGELAGRTSRLTQDREKDGHAHWSPVRDAIVFVSGRSGQGDVYLLDLATNMTSALTRGERPYLYPQWSPDGTRVAVIGGSNENHDIFVLAPGHNPPLPPRALTTWRHDDLRPVWSPDGRRLAFYSNHNALGDPKVWAIVVVAADGSDPAEGEGLAERVVARDVIPDIERGPAWLPDSRRIVYVRNEKETYNPIYVVDVETRASALLETGTRMNHDVAAAVDGTLAFRAQVEQWDQMFIARLRD
jgi:Tol biopolymer transport system component